MMLDETDRRILNRIQTRFPIAQRPYGVIAEDLGLIEELGFWTLQEAVTSALEWPKHIFIAVNVSAHEFRGGDLPGYLGRLLRETGIEARRVCLELTESTLLDPKASVQEQLADLKGLGVDIAIDDFGTGYSSLKNLWKFRFSRLKIDRSFLEGYEYDTARYRQIIEAIILLGHQMDMVVTVEGVEKQHQREEMYALGCDLFQGFLMSKPVPWKQATALIEERDAKREAQQPR